MNTYRLIIDFGNTFHKVAVFKDSSIIDIEKYENISLNQIKSFVTKYPEIKSCILSSVIETQKDILNWLKDEYFFIELSHYTPIPITNKYGSPDTLGKDRLAAAIGAYSIAPNQNVLSIDTGTAIKFDFVTKEGEYLGGSISPGLYLRFKALHTFTAKLPLVDYNNVHELIGDNTQTSILSGVMNGAIAEVNTFIDNYKLRYSDLKIFISGGESIYFERYIKSHIFADSNLVLIGLNEILIFNE
ncbi:MAG: pantothenate kinase [Bacteroidetes bacterium]|nr:MAG: pantothenate kinase [Bacteroidota bacterium]